jgi:alcohol dehydrogenase-like protein
MDAARGVGGRCILVLGEELPEADRARRVRGVLRELEHVGKPAVRDDEVLIRVHAAGVDPALWASHGWPAVPGAHRLRAAQTKARVRGIDVAGRVEAVGKEVTTLRPGRRGVRSASAKVPSPSTRPLVPTSSCRQGSAQAGEPHLRADGGRPHLGQHGPEFAVCGSGSSTREQPASRYEYTSPGRRGPRPAERRPTLRARSARQHPKARQPERGSRRRRVDPLSHGLHIRGIRFSNLGGRPHLWLRELIDRKHSLMGIA